MAEEENEGVDEVIPIHIRKERMTKSYKEIMSQDIETIDTYETRTKVNIKKWRPIYEVIDEAYIKDSKNFPGDFTRECKINSNEPQNISSGRKNNIKRMAMEKSLYAQVVKLRRKDLQFVAADKNKVKLNLSFRVNLQDHKYGLILTYIGLTYILALVNLISTRNYFKVMTISKMILRSKNFTFQLEMQNI